ncbi:reverse transcriptase domain-containing protein [Tanacetum coccineum]
MKKAQGMGIFTLESLLGKAQGVTIMDFHAGNPCVHICDPTSQSKYPMIGMNKGWRLKGVCKSAQTLKDYGGDPIMEGSTRTLLAGIFRINPELLLCYLSPLALFSEALCMRTRSQARNRNRRQQQITPVIVEEPEIPMADNRTMAQMLQAPIEGYEDAIVVPLINANNFELKQTLINLVQNIRRSNTSFSFLLFPFSLEGEARIWLDKEPPRSILTWDDLVSKFINQFFPPSKTTYLRNEIINFLQKPNETFNEAWERFKGLLRQCPHHGFSELHQLDTFYNSLNTNDQDALDSAAGGNFLDKMPRDGLAIIESKSKVRYSRSRAIEPRVSTNAPLSTSTLIISF